MPLLTRANHNKKLVGGRTIRFDSVLVFWRKTVQQKANKAIQAPLIQRRRKKTLRSGDSQSIPHDFRRGSGRIRHACSAAVLRFRRTWLRCRTPLSCNLLCHRGGAAAFEFRAIAWPRFAAKTLYQSTLWVCISSAFLAASGIATDFVVPLFARSDPRHWSWRPSVRFRLIWFLCDHTTLSTPLFRLSPCLPPRCNGWPDTRLKKKPYTLPRKIRRARPVSLQCHIFRQRHNGRPGP